MAQYLREVEACSKEAARSYSSTLFHKIIALSVNHTSKNLDPLFGLHASGKSKEIRDIRREDKIDAS